MFASISLIGTFHIQLVTMTKILKCKPWIGSFPLGLFLEKLNELKTAEGKKKNSNSNEIQSFIIHDFDYLHLDWVHIKKDR